MKRLVFTSLLLATTLTAAPQLRSRLAQLDDAEDRTRVSVPQGVRAIRNLAYGADAAQKIDVYVPPSAKGAPVLFMVHGGGWRIGDKDSRGVVDNKLRQWSAQGFIFISVNYRMLPAAAPLEQAADVARALAYAQKHAREWGADPAKFVLMGHSAGAHLVALVTSSPQLLAIAPAKPLGTVVLDSAALDVSAIMQGRHLPLYDAAFGPDPAVWRAASPLHVLKSATVPMLCVCSSRRLDSCPQAHAFAAKATSLGGRATVLEENLSHREINETLGEPSAYTTAVDSFIRSLH